MVYYIDLMIEIKTQGVMAAETNKFGINWRPFLMISFKFNLAQKKLLTHKSMTILGDFV